MEEEFGSKLSNHDEDNNNASGTTIELDKDAKASLAKEMKGKDYDVEGVYSRSSKQTHHTNMTGKTEMTSTRTVTTKKFAMDFSQNKKDLNAEGKKTALLEKGLREIKSAMAAGMPPKALIPESTLESLPSSAPPGSSIISTPSEHQDANLAQKFDAQLNLPPTPSDKPAKKSC